jgi:hypothetical protein
MEMANYIYSIIKSRRMIMWSWGFHRPMALPNEKGLVFKVNGFIHKGFVKVVYNAGQDLFTVILLDLKMNPKKEIEGVYFDSLVDVIDGAVERTQNYEQRVNEEYGL